MKIKKMPTCQTRNENRHESTVTTYGVSCDSSRHVIRVERIAVLSWPHDVFCRFLFQQQIYARRYE